MTAQDNAAFVRDIHSAWNRRDFDHIASVTSDDCKWVAIPTGQTFSGKEGLRQYSLGWASAFPDGQIQETNLIAGDDGAVIEFVGRGTHTGTLSGPAGDIPPTGRSVEMSFCEIYRIKEGKVVGGSIYFDMVTLLGQLGMMRQPAAATA